MPDMAVVLTNGELLHEYAGRVTRERDEARAAIDRVSALIDERHTLECGRLCAENDRLRALLQEWLDDATPQRRQWATNADGRTLPERTWAVLEGGNGG